MLNKYRLLMVTTRSSMISWNSFVQSTVG